MESVINELVDKGYELSNPEFRKKLKYFSKNG